MKFEECRYICDRLLEIRDRVDRMNIEKSAAAYDWMLLQGDFAEVRRLLVDSTPAVSRQQRRHLHQAFGLVIEIEGKVRACVTAYDEAP
jgi:hypothetical protein